MAAIGTVIGEKYELIAEIGRGGMSVVYLAMDRRLNKQWAVKEAKKKPGNDSAIFELTPIAEANLLKTLDHPNIVRIVDIVEQHGYIYIVEDFVQGKSLAKEVERGPSSPEDTVKWGLQLCSVLEYLHSRKPPIIYRDMKPANVQLDPDRQKIKLLDFGIAKTYKVQNTGDTYNLGTRGYAAPEQFDTNRQSDARTDIFSLGVTLRALLMGKTPNQAEFYDDIRKHNPNVTDGLVKVITKATSQNPNDRYQNAGEFRFALEHYHDNDEAVINFRRRKLASFRKLMASSIACILIGVIFLGSSLIVGSNIYTKAMNDGKYSAAIEANRWKSDAYFGIVASNGTDLFVSNNVSLLNDNFSGIRDKQEALALEAFACCPSYTSTSFANLKKLRNIENVFLYLADVTENPFKENLDGLFFINDEAAGSLEEGTLQKLTAENLNTRYLNSASLTKSIGYIGMYYAAALNMNKSLDTNFHWNMLAIKVFLDANESAIRSDNDNKELNDAITDLKKNIASDKKGEKDAEKITPTFEDYYELLAEYQYACLYYALQPQEVMSSQSAEEAQAGSDETADETAGQTAGTSGNYGRYRQYNLKDITAATEMAKVKELTDCVLEHDADYEAKVSALSGS